MKISVANRVALLQRNESLHLGLHLLWWAIFVDRTVSRVELLQFFPVTSTQFDLPPPAELVYTGGGELGLGQQSMNRFDEGQAHVAPFEHDIEDEIDRTTLVSEQVHHDRRIPIRRVMGNQRSIESSLDQGFGNTPVERIQTLQDADFHGQPVLPALHWDELWFTPIPPAWWPSRPLACQLR